MQELWIETGSRNYVVDWKQENKTAYSQRKYTDYTHEMTSSLINNGYAKIRRHFDGALGTLN